MAVAQRHSRIVAIQRLSIADQIYGELRARILSGVLARGSRIVEGQLAKSLGISRVPIREAVNPLMEAGLLESRTHYGNTVVKVTADKLHQLYAARVAGEQLAVREVVHKGRRHDLWMLKASVREMKARVRAEDLPGLVETELGFHQALWAKAGNPYIDRAAGLLVDHMRLALAVDNAVHTDLAEVAREYESLLATIAEGDLDRTAAALESHIMSALEAPARA